MGDFLTSHHYRPKGVIFNGVDDDNSDAPLKLHSVELITDVAQTALVPVVVVRDGLTDSIHSWFVL